MTKRGAWTRALLVVAAVLVVDQVSKAIVRASIEPGDSIEVFSFLHLVNTRNDGIAFGGLGGSWLVIVDGVRTSTSNTPRARSAASIG